MGDPCADLQTACRQAHQFRRRDRVVVDLGAECSFKTGILGRACNVLDLTRAPAGATPRINLYEPEPECLWHDALPFWIRALSPASLISRLKRQDHPTCRPPRPVRSGSVDKLLVRLFTRVVSRVDVFDASRPDELNLDNRLLVSCPSIVRVFRRVRQECARLEQFALIVEFFALTKPKAPADHGNGFGIGMSMRWSLIVGWELDALDDHMAGFCRVP